MLKDMYTCEDAAELLGVSKKTIARWCRIGKIPGAVLYLHSRRLGWRLPAETVDALAAGGYWMADGAIQPPLFEGAEKAG